jgi:saccharopine dehydrogenase-like NADP-dependent oxidoreductase
MKNVLVIGAGKIGSTVARLLRATGDYAVTIADNSAAALDAVARAGDAKPLQLDLNDAAALEAAARHQFAVVSVAPFHLTARVATAARAAGCHYIDATEDVATTRYVKSVAADAATAFIPQCGLAPGFISIAACDLIRQFESIDSIRLRVGALPLFPSNALNYNLTWSVDGVINEYCEPCEAIVEGQLREVPALEEREEFSLDGVTYEAFNTSGGLGSLCESYLGKVRTLNYKTIRYPGHAAIMKALLNDLRLRDDRKMLRDILERAVPSTTQDVVIVFVTATGMQDGRLVQQTYANKIRGRQIDGVWFSAIQSTTAAALCAVLDLLAGGLIPRRGLIKQEEIQLRLFLANRFGSIYVPDGEEIAAPTRRHEDFVNVLRPALRA